MDLEKLLSQIVQDSHLHARWLNTFSLLEYIGFRKIVKSQAVDELSLETLTHACEEARHAMLLKRLAIKVGGAEFNTYSASQLLCGTEAQAYFQDLDQAIDQQTTQARLTYLYVTWLVEVRALEVYEVYSRALNQSGGANPLKSLLADETKHLHDVENELRAVDPQFTQRAKQFRRLEENLYQSYAQALAHDLTTVTV